MKKMLFPSAFMFTIAFSCYGQKTPPQAVITAFDQKFPGTTVEKWEKENADAWEAEFELHGKDMSANFSAEGQWLETETEITFAELPANVQAALRGKKVKETAQIQRADGSTVYEAEVKHKDLLFDASGKMY